MSKWLGCHFSVDKDSRNKKIQHLLDQRQSIGYGDCDLYIYFDGKTNYPDLTAFFKAMRLKGLSLETTLDTQGNNRSDRKDIHDVKFPEECLPDVTVRIPWAQPIHNGGTIWKTNGNLLDFWGANFRHDIDGKFIKKLFPKRETGKILRIISLYRDSGNNVCYALETERFYYTIEFSSS